MLQKELKTQVDLGCNFFCEAVVYVGVRGSPPLFHLLTPIPTRFLHLHWRSPDTSHIMLHVGFGFHVEMTVPEAQEAIKSRVGWLERYVFIQPFSSLLCARLDSLPAPTQAEQCDDEAVG